MPQPDRAPAVGRLRVADGVDQVRFKDPPASSRLANRVVSFGTTSLDPVLFTLYDSRPEVRDGATFALLKMLSPAAKSTRDVGSRLTQFASA